MAKWRPKAALRAALAGSVYWLDELEADPQQLRKLGERGLWTDKQYYSEPRGAEGFNRLALAVWK